MSAGFVYVLINPAMPNIVKIGRTAHSSSKRAKSLSGTATPEDFVVVYDEFVTDCQAVERRLHERFHHWRCRANREFFSVPIRDAVRGLIEESVGYVVPRIGTNEGVEMLPDLKRKYSTYVRPDFHSIKIVHRERVVYLETIRSGHGGRRDEIVERTDLEFIVDGVDDAGDDQPMFSPSRAPEHNARLFVHELNAYSIMMCTDLFTEEAWKEIERRHQENEVGPA